MPSNGCNNENGMVLGCGLKYKSQGDENGVLHLIFSCNAYRSRILGTKVSPPQRSSHFRTESSSDSELGRTPLVIN